MIDRLIVLLGLAGLFSVAFIGFLFFLMKTSKRLGMSPRLEGLLGASFFFLFLLFVITSAIVIINTAVLLWGAVV